MASKRPLTIILVVILSALIGFSATVDWIRFLLGLFQKLPSNVWDGHFETYLLPLALNTSEILFLIVAIGVYKGKEWARVMGIVCVLVSIFRIANNSLMWLSFLLATKSLDQLPLFVLGLPWHWILVDTFMIVVLTGPKGKAYFTNNTMTGAGESAIGAGS